MPCGCMRGGYLRIGHSFRLGFTFQSTNNDYRILHFCYIDARRATCARAEIIVLVVASEIEERRNMFLSRLTAVPSFDIH
jgi:hypothetical protein